MGREGPSRFTASVPSDWGPAFAESPPRFHRTRPARRALRNHSFASSTNGTYPRIIGSPRSVIWATLTLNDGLGKIRHCPPGYPDGVLANRSRRWHDLRQRCGRATEIGESESCRPFAGRIKKKLLCGVPLPFRSDKQDTDRRCRTVGNED